MSVKNTLRITQTAATVAKLMDFSMPEAADCPNEIVLQAAAAKLGNKPVQRAFLYNPDAVALWLYQKYPQLFTEVVCHSSAALPVYSVMPSVTPVCFASMYTGLNPADHGIQVYTKPVLKVTTLFDAAIAAGLRPIIISTEGDSISKIFLERDMDYIICPTHEECNAHAAEVLKADQHDLVVLYNGNYDSQMHRYAPEGEEALAALKENAQTFASLSKIAAEAWGDKPGIAAFLPDHGCHEIDGKLGSHGLEMLEDMNIIHFYQFYG